MLTAVIVIFAAVLAVLGQIARPTEGYQLGNVTAGFDIIFPVSIVQCEPVLIYYNFTNEDSLFLNSPGFNGNTFLVLTFPIGVGYLDWICDIPAGYTFNAGRYFEQIFTVQPGSSSACLGEITTTYAFASYEPTYFQSYTQHTYSGSYTSYQL